MGSRHSVALSSTTRQPQSSRSSRVCPMGTCLYVSATGTCRSKATRRRPSSIASASSYPNSRNPGPSWRWTSSAASTTTAAKSSSFLSGSGCLALLASWRFMSSYRPRGHWVAQIRSDTVVLSPGRAAQHAADPGALARDRPDGLVELGEPQRIEQQAAAHDQPAIAQAVGADGLEQVLAEERALHRPPRRPGAAEELEPGRAVDVDAMRR